MDWSLLIKALLVVGSLTIGLLTSYGVLKWKNDNPIEEMVEEVIKKETGFDIDLTPATPETPDKKD